GNPFPLYPKGLAQTLTAQLRGRRRKLYKRTRNSKPPVRIRGLYWQAVPPPEAPLPAAGFPSAAPPRGQKRRSSPRRWPAADPKRGEHRAHGRRIRDRNAQRRMRRSGSCREGSPWKKSRRSPRREWIAGGGRADNRGLHLLSPSK